MVKLVAKTGAFPKRFGFVHSGTVRGNIFARRKLLAAFSQARPFPRLAKRRATSAPLRLCHTLKIAPGTAAIG